MLVIKLAAALEIDAMLLSFETAMHAPTIRNPAGTSIRTSAADIKGSRIILNSAVQLTVFQINNSIHALRLAMQHTLPFYLNIACRSLV
jgi:hypothetical protein